MKPISLMLAGVFAVLPCSCKKSGDPVDNSPDTSASTSSRTKASERSSDKDGSGNERWTPSPADDIRESPKLVQSTEDAFLSRHQITSQLKVAEAEVEHAVFLKDPDGERKAREKIATLTVELAEKERSFTRELAVLRSRLKDNPGDVDAANYVAYSDQRDRVKRMREDLEAANSSADIDAQAKLQKEYSEQMATLSSLRRAWHGVNGGE